MLVGVLAGVGAARCLISLGLVALRLIALGLNALALNALRLTALGLIVLGAGCLTTADRTPPSVAGPVSTIGVRVRLFPVLLTLVLLTLLPLILDRRLNGSGRLNTTRLEPTRGDGGRNLLLGGRDDGGSSRGGASPKICPGSGCSSCPATRLGGSVGYRTVERELLSGRTPLPGDGALTLLDRGDQVIFTHTGDVGDAHLASHLAQLRHHHSRQSGTATRRRPVARRRRSAASLVGWALVRRFRSNKVTAQ